MNILDIVGPVMVGPSSSHTAGAVRIGQTVGKLLGLLPSVLERSLHIDLPDTLEIVILLFIFAAEILG